MNGHERVASEIASDRARAALDGFPPDLGPFIPPPGALPFAPVRDLLVVEHQAERRSKDAVVVLAEENPPVEGLVLEGGPGYINDRGTWVAQPYRPGQRVLLPRASGQEFEIEGRKYVLVRADEVLGVFRKAEEIIGSAAKATSDDATPSQSQVPERLKRRCRCMKGSCEHSRGVA